MVLCDTNIFIEVYRQNLAIRLELEKIGDNNIAVSDITRAELFYGAINKAELQKIRDDMSCIVSLPIKTKISQIAVDLVAQYCLSHKLDIEDALIAATAIYYDMDFFTLNLKDFRFLPDIKLYHFKP
jgi:predicted nucleic acid-binding protein